MTAISSSFYDSEALFNMGFRSLGDNVKISKHATFYTPSTISIGSNTRIDDFAVLSGDISIGSFVHVTAHCILSAGLGGIIIKDFCALAYRVEVFAESDDYSGETLFSSLIPEEFKNVTRASVIINSYCIIGSSTTVFPGVTIGEGVAIGAKSLVNADIPSWSIAYGIPAQRRRARSNHLLTKLELFKSHEN
jgi:acetyltransferase-like isoleucine patch superfamily enzyme